jgi:hypothetical protein
MESDVHDIFPDCPRKEPCSIRDDVGTFHAAVTPKVWIEGKLNTSLP